MVPRWKSMRRNAAAGFSLIQISILLAVGGLMAAASLPGGDAGDTNARVRQTYKRMTRIEDAMKSFMTANQRRPCPASGTYAESSQYFGREAATPGTCTGSTPASDFTDGGNIVAGVVPTKALNLPDEFMYDGFGRRFTYAVDKRATLGTSCASTTTGGITVRSSSGGT